MRTVILVALLIAAAPAEAATLRPVVTLHAPVVRLQDLFADPGPDGDHVLGPGPGPGGRIVVDAPQLAYIARRFGVDWRPASPGDRAVLDRPGRPLSQAEILAPLRAALVAAGAQADGEIDLGRFTAPLVPIETTVAAVIGSLQYDPVSGRFSALLNITGATIDPVALGLSGRVETTLELPVATVRLGPGAVIGASDLRMARVRTSLINREVARRPDQAVGLQVRQQIAAGQPLPLAELMPPLLVKKGARVVMLLDSPGIALTAEGKALEAGGEGDRVRVQNPVSHAVVEAEVLADGRVRVDPGALPLRPSGGRAATLATR